MRKDRFAREERLVLQSAALPEVSQRLRGLVGLRARAAVSRRRRLRQTMFAAAACLAFCGLTVWRVSLLHSRAPDLAGTGVVYPASMTPAASGPRVRQVSRQEEAPLASPHQRSRASEPPVPAVPGGGLRSPVLMFLGDDLRQIEEQLRARRSVLEKVFSPL
jgi:hypothetical protein